MKGISIILAVLLFTACSTSGVKKEKKEKTIEQSASGEKSDAIDEMSDVIDEKVFDNGIKIKWFTRGEGENLKSGDCVSIDYKVILKDNNVVDGNHLIKKPHVPFLVGFKMQTEGWDIALKEMKVGDFAEIFIPSKYARGEKGIEGLIPPNSDNILRIRLLERKKPTRVIDGNKVWVFEENPNNTLKFGEDNEVEFHCMVSSPSNPLYINTFKDNNPFKLKLEDSGLVPGLKKALINAKKSDRMFVYIPAKEAYGAKGYLDVVKPNEDLFYNILVMDVYEK